MGRPTPYPPPDAPSAPASTQAGALLRLAGGALTLAAEISRIRHHTSIMKKRQE